MPKAAMATSLGQREEGQTGNGQRYLPGEDITAGSGTNLTGYRETLVTVE